MRVVLMNAPRMGRRAFIPTMIKILNRRSVYGKSAPWAVMVAAFVLACVPNVQAESPYVAGVCFARGVNGAPSVVVPLESTEVILDVQPGLLEAQVIQTFTNHSESALEATYMYPLPPDATLADFELRYADRVVKSEVREKAAARLEYQVARDRGQKAALLEQADPSLFSTAVANFLPGETVQVVIRFVQPLAFTSDAIELRFPMVTGDRYFPADCLAGTPGEAAANPARSAPEAVAAGHVYAFDILVAGIPVREITSSSHAIHAAAGPDGRWSVALADEITMPDRDLVLRIATRASARTQPSVVVQHTETGDYGALTLFPPMTRANSARGDQPRDILFIIDCSGSMSGPRLASAKLGLEGCLASMVAEDRFQIIPFADSHHFYAPEFTAATPAALATAIEFVRRLHVLGGTEMQPALAAGLQAFNGEGRQRLVILLTDGDVGNARSLVRLVKRTIGTTRLFTFGVGDAPNVHLLRKIATIGRGQVRFIDDDASIEREMRDLFATLDAPVLADVRYTLLDEHEQPIEAVTFPETLPDLFVGRPLQVTFRTDGRPVRFVRLMAHEDGAPVVQQFAITPEALRGGALEKQFGRSAYTELDDAWQQTDSTEEQAQLRAQMLETALEFQLVTELTSRVAVAPEVSRTPAARLTSVQVAQPRPADQTVTVKGEEVVLLSPFEVTTEEDIGYTTTATLCGCRVHTNLMDLGGATQVVTRPFLDDLAFRELEAMGSWLSEPVHDPRWAQPGPGVGLIDNLPLATLLEPGMLERFTWRSAAPPWGNAELQRAYSSRPRLVSVALADEGGVGVSVDGTMTLGADDNLVITTLVNASRAEHDRHSAYVDVRTTGDAMRLHASLLARDLAEYGRLYLVRGGAEWRPADAWQFGVAVAAHELTRDDPAQFRLGSGNFEYAGLGLFHLDRLTAETRHLRDQVASLWAAGTIDTGFGRHSWSALAGWHRQDAGWITSDPEDALPTTRQDANLQFGYSGEFFAQRIRTMAHLGWTGHEGQALAASGAGTRQWSGTVTGQLTSVFSVVAAGGHSEQIPWLPASEPTAIERRDGVKLGVNLSAWDGRLAAGVSAFRDRVSGFTMRDWAAEAAALLANGTPGPIQYARFGSFERAGWMGEINARPLRNLSLRATWYFDGKDEGPTSGGNQRGSFTARYTWLEGYWQGLFIGGGMHFQNALRFGDGFELDGDWRAHLFIGYDATRRIGLRVQLNLDNLTGAGDRATRFSPDRGREARLTVTRQF